MKVKYNHSWIILFIAAIIVAVLAMNQPKSLEDRPSDTISPNTKRAHTPTGMSKVNSRKVISEKPSIRYKQRELDTKYTTVMSELIKPDGSLTQSAFDIAGIPDALWRPVQERFNSAHEGIRQLIAANTVMVSAVDGKYQFIVKKMDGQSSDLIQKFYKDTTNLCGDKAADALANLLDNSLTTFKCGKMDTNITVENMYNSPSYSIRYDDLSNGSSSFSGGPLSALKDSYGVALYNRITDLISSE